MNDVRKELKIKDGKNAEIFPSVNATVIEFNTYLESKVYVYEHNFVHNELKYVD